MRTLGLFVLLAGCHSSALPSTVDGGGLDVGVLWCFAQSDPASCRASIGCVPLDCTRCDGTRVFAGCFVDSVPPANPGCDSDPCGCTATRDQASCAAKSGCRVEHCVQCGVDTFMGCVPANWPDDGPSCPPAPCPPPGACEQLDEDGCFQRADCHVVYQRGTPPCSNCCPIIYSACASGKADCHGTATCGNVPPDCNDAHCAGPYSVAYANGCYEGCVLSQQCAP